MKLPDRKDKAWDVASSMSRCRAIGWNMCLDEIEKINATEQPQVGEYWYVSISQDIQVREVKVTEITDMTVVLETEGWAFFGNSTANRRYVRDRINFLERARG